MVWTTRRALGSAALAALLFAESAGCTSGSGRHHLVITGDEKTTLIDQPVHLVLAGLRQGQEVTVTAEAEDFVGVGWRSTGVYRADHNGAPVPTGPIALDRIPASLLAVAGENDRLWPSPRWARQIGTPTAAAPNRQALLYLGAGHAVSGPPYPAAGSTATPIVGAPLELGGDAAANQAAHLDA
ncbi:acyl-CoA thioesterase/BAAT N-terminal domain-containing protein [Kitasatospora griseola]|uniref:acyl-CoA thioesterase/BAAT N-terminal domain-containing protein n=1 Tax=Kitasatospora griseola TaxID=2064 RepID=UPI00382F466F